MLRGEVDAVVLDIDGTLHPEVSWLKLTDGLGGSKAEHTEIFDKFKRNIIDYPTAKEQLIKLWRSTGNANKPFIEAMFRSWKLKEDAQDTVDYLKKFYSVCLISGSVDLFVEVVADRLGIIDWYANTELIWDEKGNLIDFNYYRDQAAKKLEHFEEYMRSRNLDKKRCVVVGNGDSDISLFRELRYGIAVNTDLHPEVRGLAYKTVSRLKEIRTIL